MKERGGEESRTYQSLLYLHPLSLAASRILGIPLGVDYEIPTRENYLPQILTSSRRSFRFVHTTIMDLVKESTSNKLEALLCEQ